MSSSIRALTPVMAGESNTLLTFQEMQALELEALDAFAAFCADNNLTYWLNWGTLLGAARHKGFIPWDDDIDVVMPSNDFEKMVDLANAGITPGKNYQFGSNKIKNASSDLYAYVKLYDTRTKVSQSAYRSSIKQDEGVWIDIFPLVGAPLEGEERRRLSRTSYRLFIMYTLCAWGFTPSDSWAGNMRRALMYPYANLRGYKHWLKAFDDLLLTYPQFGSTAYCAAPPYDSVTYELEDFQKTVFVEFEGKGYPAPAGYDRVLHADYGDYLQLPPEDQRKSTHEFTAVWR